MQLQKQFGLAGDPTAVLGDYLLTRAVPANYKWISPFGWSADIHIGSLAHVIHMDNGSSHWDSVVEHSRFNRA
jgi:hypothetical protein